MRMKGKVNTKTHVDVKVRYCNSKLLSIYQMMHVIWRKGNALQEVVQVLGIAVRVILVQAGLEERVAMEAAPEARWG